MQFYSSYIRIILHTLRKCLNIFADKQLQFFNLVFVPSLFFGGAISDLISDILKKKFRPFQFFIGQSYFYFQTFSFFFWTASFFKIRRFPCLIWTYYYFSVQTCNYIAEACHQITTGGRKGQERCVETYWDRCLAIWQQSGRLNTDWLSSGSHLAIATTSPIINCWQHEQGNFFCLFALWYQHYVVVCSLMLSWLLLVNGYW